MRVNRNRVVSVLLAAALAAAGCGGGDGGETAGDGRAKRRAGAFPGEHLSLLLISLDTCRPDHLGCYGYEEIDTPRIDELAAAGVRFERTLAAAPITLPSHASLFTGNYPYRHRVRNNATYRLPESALTLAEWMKRRGYDTAAFVASYPMDSRFGLDQGFDLYDDRLPLLEDKDPLFAEIRAEEVAERAIAWLEEREEEAPFFLFLHFFDPHWRYRPPEPFASLYPGRPYDGEIAYLDGEVGRVLDALDRLDLAGRTVVILTGDHGEGLGEHGEATHAVFLYDSTLRVPFLVRTPDREEFRSTGWTPGRRVERMVRGVDIAPTALDLLGLPPMPEVEGVSLAPLVADPASFPPLTHYAETFAPREDYGWSEARAIVTERWKYILLPREELYDLTADPGEERNRIDEERGTADRLRSLLEERIAADRERAGGEERRTLGAEERARFEALGYVTRGGREDSTGSGGALPDPKDRISLLDDLYGAFAYLDRGEGEAALAGLERVLEKDPGNTQAAKAKGDAYALMGEWAAAESLYRELIPRRPHDLFLRASRGYALIRLGRAEEARKVYGDLLARDPEYPEGNVRLGECLLLLGEWDEAEAAFRRELAIRPGSAAGYGGLGKVYRLRGEREEAIRAFRKAIELRPDFGPAYRNLGNLYEETGEWEKVIRYYKKGIEVDPDMVETYYNLALVAKRMNRRDAAAELLGRAVERNPRFAKGYFGLGNLLREEGRYAQAIVQYEIALRYDPGDPDVHLNLGVAHAALGMLDEAIRDWEAAVKAAPGSPSAETARRNIEGARTGRGGTR